MPSRPRVVIDNGVIAALMADPRVTALFPSCFAGLLPKPGGCARCQQKDAAAFAGAKECLLAAPPEARERLKALLDADEVKIVVLRGGEAREFTF